MAEIHGKQGKIEWRRIEQVRAIQKLAIPKPPPLQGKDRFGNDKEHPNASPGVIKAVLLAIDGKTCGGNWRMSLDEIAKITCMSRPTVKRAVWQLEAWGLLAVARIKELGYGNRWSDYSICWPTVMDVIDGEIVLEKWTGAVPHGEEATVPPEPTPRFSLNRGGVQPEPTSVPPEPTTRFSLNRGGVQPEPTEKALKNSLKELPQELPQENGLAAQACAEPPKTAGSAPTDEVACPLSEYIFPTKGKGPQTWNVRQDKLEEYREAYPDLDVDAEFRRARQWCRDNPARRKTANGMLSFLTRWLNRAQNSGRGGPVGTSDREARGAAATRNWLEKTYGAK